MRESSSNKSRQRSLGPVLLLGLPLVLRLLCLLQLQGSEIFRLLVVDARSYHDMAAALAAGRWDQVGPFWQPPFYPYFLALLYKLATPDPIVARIAQAILGSISCLLIFRLGARFFGRRAAWIAWGIAAAYGPFIFFDLQILNASLVTFLLLVALEILTAAEGRWRLAAAGLAAGLAAITVATSLVTIPVFAAWIALKNRGEMPGGRDAMPSRAAAGTARGRWLSAAIFLGVAAVPVATVTAVNLAHCGEIVLVSYNAGINFWIGNNPDYDSTVAIRPGRSWDALDKELRLARVPTAAQSSGYWFRKSIRWIGSHSADWTRLLLHKTRLYLRGDEIWRNQEIYPFRQSSWILRALIWIHGIAFPFGVLLPLGAAGTLTIFIRRRVDRAPAFLLLLLILVYSAAVIAFFPAGRYRVPVAPWLILFAAGGISAWTDDAVRGNRRSLVIPAGVVLALGLLSNSGLPAMSSRFNSDAYSDLGFSYQERGKLDEARRQYETALGADGNNTEALNNLGTILLLQKKPGEAKPYFQRVLDRYPDDRKANTNLGTIYLQSSEPYWAGYYFSRARESDPTAPLAAEGVRLSAQLADQLEMQEMSTDPDGFLRLLEGFLREEPRNGFLYERLMPLLEGKGLYERALAMVRIRLALMPGDTDLRLTAARLLERMGRGAESRRVLEGAQP
jgi:tetratricopeptide (TPR) repeat protein